MVSWHNKHRKLLFWISVSCLVINIIMMLTGTDNEITPYVMALLIVGALANK